MNITMDHYAILTLPETATVEEIKRAYFRLVRRYRPGQNPEMFQRLNDARSVLGNPDRRREYDQMRRNGERVQKLLDRAREILESEPGRAVALLQEAVRLAPDLPAGRALLADACMRAAQYPTAETEFRWLLAHSPRDEALHYGLARCLSLQDRAADAEWELADALTMNPLYHQALMLLSHVCQMLHKIPAAVDALERAIATDGVENLADMDALLRLLALHVQTGQVHGAEQTARRIEAVFPPDDEALQPALASLARHAIQCCHAGSYAVARAVLPLARHPRLRDSELAARLDKLSVTLSRAEEAERLCGDEFVAGSLQAYIRACYLDRSSDEHKQVRRDAARNHLQREMSTDPGPATRMITYFRREYPRLAEEQTASLQAIYAEAEAIKRRSAATSAVPAAASPEAMPTVGDAPGGRGLLGWLRKR